jgi:flagellar L-ring protein precursor FlgH
MSKPLSFLYKGVALGVLSAILPVSLNADSLWRDETSRSMAADIRAHAVGDILTIVVQESNTATKDSSTKTGKSTDVDASISTFLYPVSAGGNLLTRKGQLPALQYSTKNDFNGGGTVNNSEQISARIAVKVVDVLPNGNLLVEGSRQTAFASENQTIVLRGTVRQEDISSFNTIFSYNIADASIKFVSNGSVADSQRKGWFTRIFDKVSPF